MLTMTMTMLPTGWRSHHRSRLPFHILCHPVPPALSQLRPCERFFLLDNFEIAIKEVLALGFQNIPKPKPLTYITYILPIYITYIGVGVGMARDAATLMVGQYFKRRREMVRWKE